jgi:DNA-binding transcriptional MerR regulator
MERTISAAAAAVGVRADTLRYYERVGLLPRAARTAAGYRVYGEEATERLHFIRSAKRMGLRLADIKELLDVRDGGQCPCGRTEVLVDRRLAEVESEIEQLASVRRQLLALKQLNEQCVAQAAASGGPLVTNRERRRR